MMSGMTYPTIIVTDDIAWIFFKNVTEINCKSSIDDEEKITTINLKNFSILSKESFIDVISKTWKKIYT